MKFIANISMCDPSFYVPLAQATKRMKTVPLDCDTIRTARELGICLGD